MANAGTYPASRAVPRFEEGLGSKTVVPIVWDALSAAAARSAGATHLSLSGAAFSNSHGYPDRGLMSVADVARVINEISNAVALPVMVDGEAGHGGGPRLCRLVEELLRARCTALMIEDQVDAGETKTVGVAPSLCSPETMCERIDLVRSEFDREMSLLARTDYLFGMDPGESLERMAMYLEAGADWVQFQYVPSKEAAMDASRRFPGRLMLHGSSAGAVSRKKYLPTIEELDEINPVAIKITGQYRNAHAALVRAYAQTLEGNWTELFADRFEAAAFDESLGLTRPGMTG